MIRTLAIFFKKIDWVLFALFFLLVVVGLVIQYCLILNGKAPDFLPFYKQLLAFVLGLVLFFLLSYFDFRWFRTYAYLLYAVSLILLLGLFFFGETLRGTRGWYIFGPFGFQPVELIKIFILIFLAKYFSVSLRQIAGPGFLALILSGILTAIPFVLIIFQPDLGSALIVFGVWFLFFLIIAKKKIHILAVVVMLIIAAVTAWLFLLRDYQKERVLTFLDSNRDPLGAGYQVNQSITAIGSGKFFGRGLGLGPQSQLRFLPDAGTDFIFSVIGEEFGFFGTLIVLGLFGLLFWRLAGYAKIAYSDFGLLFILGFLGLIFLEFFINVGMNLGLLPVAGIPLPFVSYGNSSLLALFVGLGIIQSIKVHQVKIKEF